MAQKLDHVDLLIRRWAQIHPEASAQSYPALLRAIRAGRLVDEAFQRVAKANGLSVRGDYDVLAALRRALPHHLQPSELAHVSMVTNSGMTGRLDRLELEGLIRRTPHPGDRRALLIQITTDGVETVDRVFVDLIKASTTLLDSELAASLEHPLRRLMLQLGDGGA
jgi:DNA-binding MarR family transcriptional regulator